ncbi:protein tyrosine phosphatase [Paenibacillaceae bacterium]|nr:protein tyrosine phosphatase [Paenibacillaceae bacterium]
MIDIHTHLLPGIDDGAATWEDSLALARAAVQEGVASVIATPHHATTRYTNEADDIVRLTQEANERLQLAGIPLQVLSGQEIRVHDDLLDAWSRGELLTLGGSMYILLEMPASSIPRSMPDLIHELKLLGLKPIIAHPERNAEVARHPASFAALVEAGAYGQMTAHSLLGGFGGGIQRIAWTLCSSGLIHVISSDVHNLQPRGFRLAEAYEQVGRRMGTAWRDYYQNNADSIARNQPFALPPAPARGNVGWRAKIAAVLRGG